MADIVMVHGINAHRSNRSEMHDRWLAALSEGLQNMRFPRVDSLTAECAFYGHLYNDGKFDPDSHYEVGDLAPGLEQDLLIALAEEVGDPSDDTVHKAGYASRGVQWALHRLQSRKFLDGVSTTILRFVKQVARYLKEAEFAEKVWAEISAAMEHRPRVVIAHSLGSIVAYDWLRSNPPTSATTLITLGSPLGLRVITKAVHPYIDACPAPWPTGIRTWVNIAAKEDVVATVKKLNGLFAGEIDDRSASNPRDAAHDVLAYLRNVRTAKATMVALD